MSLDVRAAALPAGASGLRGWAAKAQCGLPPVPGRLPGPRPPRVDDPIADTLVFGDRAIR
jgi:hypothetical protein